MKNFLLIRRSLLFFITALLLSGLTVLPLNAELDFLSRCFPVGSGAGSWIYRVQLAIAEMSSRFPFLLYGYDWLAYAHLILAILFIGPYRDPIRNKWVIEFGLIACALIIPVALIAGHLRGIPIWWRLVDCSFGFIGFIPLFISLRAIHRIESINQQKQIWTLEQTRIS